MFGTVKKSYKIRTKLLWMLLPLLLSLTTASTFIIYQEYKQYKVSLLSNYIVEISIKISNLIHAIQEERGISTSYAANHNKKYFDILKSKRDTTDSSFKMLIEYIAEHNKYKEIENRIDIIQNEANLLKEIRKKIDNDTCEHIFNRYSVIIAQLLQSINHLFLNSADKTLAKDKNAYLRLLWMQESAAKERGLLNSVFEAKKIDSATYIKINEYNSRFKQLLYSFNAIAGQEYKEMLQQKLLSPDIQSVKDIRTSIINKIHRNEFINNLLPLLGYQGMIHNIKNYFIQGDDESIKLFKNNYKEAIDIIKKEYDKEYLSKNDKKNILIIESTIKAYAQMLPKIIKIKNSKKPISEVDDFIKIDDLATSNAIEYLRDNISVMHMDDWWRLSTKRLNYIKQVSDKLQEEIYLKSKEIMSSTAIVLVILIIAAILIIGMSLFLGVVIMEKTIKGLIKTTQVIDKMRKSGNYTRKLPIDGSDELSQMRLAFNQLIADRNKTESSLRLADEVFNNVREAIVVLNKNMKVEIINPAFTEMTGYFFEELKDKKYSFMLSDKHDRSFYSEIRTGLVKNDCWDGELWSKRKNGKTYPVLLNIHIIRDKNRNINRYIGILRDITQRKKYEQKILYQANYDSLTGLANRHSGMERIYHELKVAKRNNILVALMFIDLDGFKSVNDTLGHEYGDLLLKEIAVRFKNSVREVDTVARIGGDEFIIILPGVEDESNVEKIANKIIQAVSSEPYKLKEEICNSVSASIGVCIFPNDAQDGDTLLSCADGMMYKVKESGKNNYMLFSKELLSKNLQKRFL